MKQKLKCIDNCAGYPDCEEFAKENQLILEWHLGMFGAHDGYWF